MERVKLEELIKEAERLLKINDHQQASYKLEEIIALTDENSNSDLYWLARTWRAFLNATTDRLPQAFSEAHSAIEVAEQTKNIVLHFWSAYTLSALYLENIQLNEAKEYALKAYSLAKLLGDRSKALIILQVMGIAYSKDNELHIAEGYFREWLKVAGKNSPSLHLAHTYCNLGYVKFQQGELEEALELTLEALRIFQKQGSDTLIANCHLNLGKIYTDQGRLELAGKYLHSCKEVFKKSGMDRRIVFADEYLGKLMILEGKTEEGLSLLREVRNIYSRYSIADRKRVEEMIAEYEHSS